MSMKVRVIESLKQRCEQIFPLILFEYWKCFDKAALGWKVFSLGFFTVNPNPHLIHVCYEYNVYFNLICFRNH